MNQHHIPELHITKYGEPVRADQLVSTAKYMATLLAALTPYSNKSITLDDGSTVFVARRESLYLATIWGAYPRAGGAKKTDKTEEPPTIAHGIVTNPQISSGAVLEFTKSKQIRGEKEEARIPNPTLKNPVAAALREYFNPTTQSWSQSGVMTPTLYSGRMRDAVQMAMAMSTAQIEYSPGFYTTHSLMSIGGAFMVVEVSAKGVRIAPLGVTKVGDATATGFGEIITEFGGIPDGKLPSGWVELLDEFDLAPLYDGANPVFDPLHGWVFNSLGDTAMIIMEYGDEDVGYTTQQHTLEIQFSEFSGEYSAEILSVEAQPITCPTQFHLCDYLLAPTHQIQMTKTANYNATLYYNWAIFHGSETIAEPVPGMPNSSSWNISYVPVWHYVRTKGAGFFSQNMAEAQVKRYPYYKHKPTTMHTVDAPIHVTCVDDVFIVMNYFWALYPVRNLGHTMLNAGGSQVLEEASDFTTPNSYHYYGPLLGVPSTVYTSLVDTRRFGAMNSFVHHHWYDLPDGLRKTAVGAANVMFEYRFENTHMHDEIVLPHLCREAFIHNSYDYRGRFIAATDAEFSHTIAYDSADRRDIIPSSVVGDIMSGGVNSYTMVDQGVDEESGDDVYVYDDKQDNAIPRLSTMAVTPLKRPYAVPPTRVDGVEEYMRPLSMNDVRIGWSHFTRATSGRFISAPEGFPYIPDEYVGYTVSTFLEIPTLTTATYYAAYGAHPAPPGRDFAQTPPTQYEYEFLDADRTNIYGYIVDPAATASRSFFGGLSEDGIFYYVKDYSTGGSATYGMGFGPKYAPHYSNGIDDLFDSKGYPGNEYDYDIDDAIAYALANNTPVQNRPGQPSRLTKGYPIWHMCSPDYSKVRVYCPGLALEDEEPAEPYVPRFSNCHYARVFTPLTTRGASMGYSTVGTFSVFIKTKDDNCAGFGALPRGLTLTTDDTICYVGELKDG